MLTEVSHIKNTCNVLCFAELNMCIKIFSMIRGEDFERSDLFGVEISLTHFQYDFKKGF